jgi:hypothetical protein
MLSGTLSLITNFNEKPGEENPKAGEKIQLLDGEFYVVHESHSWSYGGAPKLSLTVTRGCVYNQEGHIPEDDTLLQKYTFYQINVYN